MSLLVTDGTLVDGVNPDRLVLVIKEGQVVKGLR